MSFHGAYLQCRERSTETTNHNTGPSNSRATQQHMGVLRKRNGGWLGDSWNAPWKRSTAFTSTSEMNLSFSFPMGNVNSQSVFSLEVFQEPSELWQKNAWCDRFTLIQWAAIFEVKVPSYPNCTITRFLLPHLWVGILLDCEPRELQRKGGSQIMCKRVCVNMRFRQETQGSKNAASLCNDMNGNYQWNFHQGFATSGAIHRWHHKKGHQNHFKKVERPQISLTTWKKKNQPKHFRSSIKRQH